MGDMLKRYRKERGLTIRQLAGELEMSFQHVQALESGRCGVSVGKAAEIAGKLHMDVDKAIASVLQAALDKAGYHELRVVLRARVKG
jgi:transcriptional regulator with XRE-family HTH domain